MCWRTGWVEDRAGTKDRQGRETDWDEENVLKKPFLSSSGYHSMCALAKGERCGGGAWQRWGV